MKETQGQRRYFIAGSKSLSAYKGTIRSSAKTNANELGKNVMAMRAKRYYLPGGKREHVLEVMGNNIQVPYLVDPNTNVKMFESKDIVDYLKRQYGY